MTLRVDMFDIHKKRLGFITEDYKKLVVNYQFRGSLFIFKSDEKEIPNFEKENKIESEKLNGKIVYHYRPKEKEFDFIFVQGKKDFIHLYEIFLVIAFGLGENIVLDFFLENFPYYPTTHYLNIREEGPEWIRFRIDLVTNPESFIACGLNLIKDSKSYFHELIPILLEINALAFNDIVFATEYGILERLSSKIRKSGIIYAEKTKEYKELKKFSGEILDVLSKKYKNVDSKSLRKKLKFDTLNYKSVTKEKIYDFLDSFNNQNIRNAKENVTTWNEMRINTLVHGCYGSRLAYFKKHIDLAKKLHRLLLTILSEEFWNELYGRKG
jgi:hypothetical protein